MIYLLIGRRERGKTTLAYYMSRKLRKRVIIDARQMIQRVDVEIVNRAEDLPAALNEMVNDPALNEIVYQPQDDDLDQAFDKWTTAVKERLVSSPRMPIALMIDEASFYNLESTRFQWIAKCTYREMVHIIITAHRPADIPTSIRAIADHWCIFSTTQEHDLKVIEQRTGSVRPVNAVRRLTGRNYVHWDDAKGNVAVCEDPKAWYVSMGTPAARHTALVEIPEKDWELEP